MSSFGSSVPTPPMTVMHTVSAVVGPDDVGEPFDADVDDLAAVFHQAVGVTDQDGARAGSR